MKRPPNCKAYERGDQWFCDRCGVTWDHNDDDPPECKPDHGSNDRRNAENLAKAAKKVNDACISVKQFGDNMKKLREALNKESEK